MSLRPPQEHIDLALAIEARARRDNDLSRYLECMSGVPMSERHSDQDLRDGCILTHRFYVCLRDQDNGFEPH